MVEEVLLLPWESVYFGRKSSWMVSTLGGPYNSAAAQMVPALKAPNYSCTMRFVRSAKTRKADKAQPRRRSSASWHSRSTRVG